MDWMQRNLVVTATAPDPGERALTSPDELTEKAARLLDKYVVIAHAPARSQHLVHEPVGSV
jgi:hypothetical protein